MRWLAVAFSAAVIGLPAQASDELSPAAAGLTPFDDTVLAMTTGGAAAALGLGAAAEAAAPSVDLTATSSLQASISHSAAPLAGLLTTGDISLGETSGAMGGMTSLQLSTGINTIQQNSTALAFVF